MFMFSCRFETKMRQNAPNPISISIFSGSDTPGRPPLGLCPRPLGRGERGRTGKEGRKREREGTERGRRGEEGKGMGKFASLPLGG